MTFLRKYENFILGKYRNSAAENAESFTPAEKVVFQIVDDLTGRRGLKQEWYGIDNEIQEEIFEKWTGIVSENYPPKTENDALLTPQYLLSLGFVKDENGFYSEPHIKERDRIWINFTGEYYRVWHGSAKIFINLKNKQAWFDAYYKLMRD